MNNITNYNQRHMPGGRYLKMRKINYVLYAKLQQLSNWNQDENHRYLKISDINKTQISKEIKSKPATIRKQLKELENENLIQYVECGKDSYYKLLVVEHHYELVDLDLNFFRLMIKFTSDVVWRIYLVHKGEARRVKYKYGKNTHFITREEIANRIGYSKTNLQKVTDTNEFLKEIGCISYETKYIHENGSTIQVNEYKVLK